MRDQETIRLPNLNCDPFVGFIFLSGLANPCLKRSLFIHNLLMKELRQCENT